MELTEVVRELLGDIRQLAQSESVIGKPVQVGDALIIPVTKLSVGFGTGQGEGGRPGDGGKMGAIGGGISLDPQGFLVVDKLGTARLIALSEAKQGALAKALEAVPKVVEKLVSLKHEDGSLRLPGKGGSTPPTAEQA
jgi:uncharacterized spore protein YtfJ